MNRGLESPGKTACLVTAFRVRGLYLTKDKNVRQNIYLWQLYHRDTSKTHAGLPCRQGTLIGLVMKGKPEPLPLRTQCLGLPCPVDPHQALFLACKVVPPYFGLANALETDLDPTQALGHVSLDSMFGAPTCRLFPSHLHDQTKAGTVKPNKSGYV